MNLLVGVICIGTMVVAAPYQPDYPNNVQVLNYENDNIGLGNYRYAFSQSDGTRAEQFGEIKNPGSETESLAVRGSFSWVGPDGVTYTVNYTADENGYKPEFGIEPLIVAGRPPAAAPPAVVASLLG